MATLPIRSLYRQDDAVVAKLEDGTERELCRARHSFYVKTAKRLTGVDSEPATNGYRKVYEQWKDREELAEVVKHYRRVGLDPLEADVRVEDRVLGDRLDIDVSRHVSWIMLDLECEDDPAVVDFKRKVTFRVLSFAWRGSDGKSGFDRVEKMGSNDAERALLRKISKVVRDYDVMLAWNGGREWDRGGEKDGPEGFDFPVIRAREKALGIVGIDWRRAMCIDHLHLFRKFFLQTSDGEQRSSWGLDAVGRTYVGMTKVAIKKRLGEMGIDISRGIMRAAYEKAPELLEEYNRNDVDLMWAIEQKSGYLELQLEICRLVGCLPRSDSLTPTRIMDALMFRLGTATGHHWPTKIAGVNIDYKGGDSVDGASVLAVVPGLSTGVSVLDVAGMYPSIIRALNLSPEAKREDGPLAPVMADMEGRPTDQVIARFAGYDQPGQLPSGIERMMTARERYEAELQVTEMGSQRFDDLKRLSNAAKITTNAMYGIILQRGSRYYDEQVGSAVTSTGRLLIRSVVGAIEARGFRVILKDTDSAAFECGPDDAVPVMEEINRDVFPRTLGVLGVPADLSRRLMKIKYEERYSRLFQLRTKGYAGIFELYRGVPAKEEKFDIKGLELVRGDAVQLARKLQRRVVEQILRGDAPAQIRAICEAAKTEVMEGSPTFEEVAIRQGITKNLDDYKSVTPHVRAARRAEMLGIELEGGKVAYWLAVGAQELLEDDFDLERLDRRTYWDDKVWKPTERVCAVAFPEHDWHLSTKGHQLSLLGEAPQPRRRLVAEEPKPRAGRRVVEEAPEEMRLRFELSADAEGDGPRDRMRLNRIRELCRENPGATRLVLELRVQGAPWMTVLVTEVEVDAAKVREPAETLSIIRREPENLTLL